MKTLTYNIINSHCTLCGEIIDAGEDIVIVEKTICMEYYKEIRVHKECLDICHTMCPKCYHKKGECVCK